MSFRWRRLRAPRSPLRLLLESVSVASARAIKRPARALNLFLSLASPGRFCCLCACMLGLGTATSHSRHRLLGQQLAIHPVPRLYLLSEGPAQAQASIAACVRVRRALAVPPTTWPRLLGPRPVSLPVRRDLPSRAGFATICLCLSDGGACERRAAY